MKMYIGSLVFFLVYAALYGGNGETTLLTALSNVTENDVEEPLCPLSLEALECIGAVADGVVCWSESNKRDYQDPHVGPEDNQGDLKYRSIDEEKRVVKSCSYGTFEAPIRAELEDIEPE